MPWRIVADSDAQEVFRYPTTFPEQFTDQYPLDTYTHLLTENGADPDSFRPAKAEDGSVTLVPNPDWYWTQLRAERNRRLAATDWTQLADAHLSQEKKDAWAAYRQELRDLPDEVTESMLVVTSPSDSVPWPLDPTQIPPTPVTGSRLNGILGQV
jgi:hypothetical protein